MDTEKFFYKAAREVLRKANFDFTEDMYVDLVLIKAVGPWHFLEERGYTAETIRKMKSERDNLYMNYLMTNDILIQDAEHVVSELAGSFKMAIVTSSKPEHFYAIHSRTGLLKYFDLVVTCEDYTRFKPDPEPYLTALTKMGLDKNETIVIEDSRRGLLSAKTAGLDCIIIPNDLTGRSDFSEADLVLSSISELTEFLSTLK